MKPGIHRQRTFQNVQLCEVWLSHTWPQLGLAPSESGIKLGTWHMECSLSCKVLAHFQRGVSSPPVFVPRPSAYAKGIFEFFLNSQSLHVQVLINIMGINLCMSPFCAEAALCMMHLYAFRVYIVCKSVTVD